MSDPERNRDGSILADVPHRSAGVNVEIDYLAGNWVPIEVAAEQAFWRLRALFTRFTIHKKLFYLFRVIPENYDFGGSFLHHKLRS